MTLLLLEMATSLVRGANCNGSIEGQDEALLAQHIMLGVHIFATQ